MKDFILQNTEQTGLNPTELKKELLQRQEKIVFDEDTHTYTVDNTKLMSGTAFRQQYFEAFNSEKISSYIARRDGVKQQDILDKWQEARDYGTKVHNEIENYYLNGSSPSTSDAELGIDFFDNYLEKSDTVSTHPELQIYDEEAGVAGTIDMIIFHKNGQLSLLDWKTNKKITKKAYKDKTGFGPCSNIPDTKYHKYTLQMSLYAHMIEKNISYKNTTSLIRDLILVHIRPSKYNWWSVTYEKDTIQCMMEDIS